MASLTLQMAIDEPTLRGDRRLALMAIGDCSGRASAESVARWCNVAIEEAAVLLTELADHGWIEWSGEYWIQPQMIAALEGARTRCDRRPEAATAEPTIPAFTPSRAKRKRIYARDGYSCHYCGSRLRLTLDHKVPQSAGGGHEDENLVTCCKACNSAKGSRSYEEFVAWVQSEAGETGDRS